MSKKFDVAALSASWQAVTAQVGALKVPVTEKDHKACVALLDSLLDATHGDQNHALSPLVRLVSDLIEVYESKHLQEPSANPAEVLALLMTENKLKQTDLAQELGGQSVVSDLLNGKREFNIRHARALSRRFGVSPALFIAAPTPAAPAPGRVAENFAPLLDVTSIYELVKAIYKEHRSTSDAKVYLGQDRLIGAGMRTTATSTASTRTPIVQIQREFHRDLIIS